MAWTVDDVDKHKKGLGDKEKRQWVRVANSALKKGVSEGSAIRMANGVVGGHKSLYFDGGRATPEEEKHYSDLYQELWRPYGGATSFEEIEAYFNAQEDASKIGDLTYQFRNIVDNILGDDEVGDKASAIGTAAVEYQARLTSGEVPGYKEVGTEPTPIRVTKGVDGQPTRVTFIVSNKYRDHDGVPEIISESAHLQWAKDATDNHLPIVAQLWHTPGTEWADIDHVDVVDGFLVESGIVRPGFEELAKSLADDPTLGVSHGYHITKRDSTDWTIINGYKQHEVSVLPLRWAANILTGILGSKEAEVDAVKRAFLVGKLGEAKVVELEGRIKDLGEVATGLGLEGKELVEALAPAQSPTATKSGEPAPEPSAPTPEPVPAAEITKGTELPTVDLITKAINDAVSAQFKGINDYLVKVDARMTEIEGGIQAAVKKEITPKGMDVAHIWDHRPSESTKNLKEGQEVAFTPSTSDKELDTLLAGVFPGAQ